ncbi:MAG: HEAT repeat domain-containing protein, partial [Planctomycetia bacterium]|nr:HEAT repeat domain-containing protein [Planctomycetia bacterium]
MTRKSLTGAKWKLCLIAAAVIGGVAALAATAKSGTPATAASGTPAAKITGASATAEVPRLELHPGDHVVLIGSGLAERMQYFGNFETLLHERFPTHKLVVRNLAWSADEPYLRPRSGGFGSPDQHLARQQADVVLMFFGFNESFAGPAGLPKFEQDLGRLIDDMRKQKYNGKSAPRLALISPIAFEDLGDPNRPDGKTQNANLRLYTAAMARVAAAKQVPLADIYAPSREVMNSSTGKLNGAKLNAEKLTIDGVHLSAAGDRRVAELLDAELFGAPKDAKARNSDALRAAVNEKSLQFFHRYRAINGCYIYGGRAHPFGVVSFPAEMKKLDQMTAIRDQRIWDIAQGKPVPEQIDDSKTEPLPQIKSNFGGQIVVRTPEDSRKQMTLAKGYEASLFASEVEFPDLKSPLQMTFDARGRLWVCTMPSYPQLVPGVPPDDRILVFEDTDGDGKADKETVFASGLHVATGFELGHGGVYVAQIPNMLFLQDTDGDGKADRQEVILSGFDSADSHHSEHTFTWGPDGGLYMQEGVFHHSQIESPYGPLRLQDAGIFRYEPRSGKVEAYVSYGFANPWGHVFDRWGQDYISDASGGHNYFAAPMSGHVDYPRKHSGGAPQLLPPQTRPNTECELVSSRQFRDEDQGNYLVGNVISFQGVLQYKLMAQGSGMVMKPVEPLLRSSDPTFRPTDVKFGPDGALYVIDWFNPLIGHMQHSLRDPKRDHSHGRIWRITATGRPLVKPVQIAGEPIPVLLDLLKTYEDRTRYRVRRELWERKTADVMAALPTWIAGLDQKDPEYQRHLLEALWMHQAHNVIDEGLLKQLLNSPDARVRSASLRVLAQWRDRIDGALDQAIRLAGDADPHVRLEAVRAASFFRDYAAVSVVEQAAQKPQDESLRYTIRETLNTLQPYRDGTAHPPMSAFILNSYSNKDLLKLPRTELIHTAILDRAKIGRKQRLDSLQALAKLHKKDAAAELVVALKRQDAASEDAAAGALVELGELLTSQPAAALAAQRSACEQLALNGKRELSRQIAFAAIVTCDNSFDKAEKLAEQNPQRLADLMAAAVRV